MKILKELSPAVGSHPVILKLRCMSFILEILTDDVYVLFQDIDSDGPEPSDWDKYASEEYEILVAEETANEQLHEGYDTRCTLIHQCF